MIAMVDPIRDASSLGSHLKKRTSRNTDYSAFRHGSVILRGECGPINDDGGAAALCACTSRLESRDGGGA